jgi:sugar phosphate permease
MGKSQSYLRILLATICITYFVENFLRSTASALTPILIEELAISHGKMGLLISAFFFVYGVMQVPSGVLSDALGAKKTIIGFTALTVLGVSLFWFSKNYNLLAVAQLLIGVGCSVFYINAVKLVSIWFPADKKATAIGVLSAASGLGNFVAYMGFPLAVERFGDWRILYLGMSLLLVLTWIMNFFVLKDKQDIVFAGPHSEGKSIIKNLLETITDRRLLPFIAGYTLASFSWVFLNWLPQFLIDVKGFDYISAGEIASAGSIAGIPGCIVIAAISDRLKKRKLPIIIFSSIYTVLLFIFLWLPASFPKIIFLGMGFTLTFMVSFWVLFFSMIPETLPTEKAGVGLGLVNGLGTIGFSFVAPLYGGLVDVTGGYKASNAFLLGGAILMTVIFYLFLKESYGGLQNISSV